MQTSQQNLKLKEQCIEMEKREKKRRGGGVGGGVGKREEHC